MGHFYIIGEKRPVFRTSKFERVNTTFLISINKIQIIFMTSNFMTADISCCNEVVSTMARKCYVLCKGW